MLENKWIKLRQRDYTYEKLTIFKVCESNQRLTNEMCTIRIVSKHLVVKSSMWQIDCPPYRINLCCQWKRERKKGGTVRRATKKFGIRVIVVDAKRKIRWLAARVFPDKSRGEIRDFKMQLFRARARHKRRHYTAAQRVPDASRCAQHEGTHVR